MDNLNRQSDPKLQAKSELPLGVQRKINKLLEEASFAYDSTYNETGADQSRIQKLRTRARALANRATAIQSDNPDAINLLGRLALDEANFDQAADILDEGLRVHPTSLSLKYSRGHVHLAQQQYRQAEALFDQVELKAPGATRAKASLAFTRTKLGGFVEAFADYRDLIKLDPSDPHIKNKLFECLRHIQADYYAPELENELISYLRLDDVDHNDLSNFAASLLIHKYDLIEGTSALDPQQLSNDTFLNLALRRCEFRSPVVEEFLTACRQCILQESIDKQRIEPRFMEFLVSLSIQCINNQFVYAVSLTEEKIIHELQNMVSETVVSQDWQVQDVEYPLLLLSLYSLLHHHGFRDQLLRKPLSSWSEEVQPVIEPHLYEPQKERQIEQRIESLGAIHHATSIEVAKQYEQHPYPRWRKLAYASPTDYAQALSAELVDFATPSFLQNQTIRILIAGCGTGRHALQVAKHFRNVEVTAVDLSRASLAYGLKQARALKINNIEFFQADILNLPEQPRYHIIESSGVLHHMDEPLVGWAALRDRLEPGGLMKISLYSGRARQIISKARQVIQENKLLANDEHIRIFRQAILDGTVSGDFGPVIQSNDFYNLSGTRDLLFNVKEHLFSPLALGACLNSLDLAFLGFVHLPYEVKQVFHKNFPDDPRRVNLEHWDKFEEAAPDVFGNMYQFYCQLQSNNIARIR